LIQEWKSAFPALEKMLNIFAQNKKSILRFSDLMADDVAAAIALDLCDPKLKNDPVAAESQVYINSKGASQLPFLQLLIATLYRSGAVGLKLDTSEPYIYAHLNQPLVSPHLIRDSTKIRLHPMLHAAYHLHEA